MQTYASRACSALPPHHPGLAPRGSKVSDAAVARAARMRCKSGGGEAGEERWNTHVRHKLQLGAAAVAASLSAAGAASAAAEALQDPTAAAAAARAAYVPGPSEVGWEVWAGFIAGVVPFAIASYEFGKRILIQRRCPSCRGRGLVQRGRYLRKCAECGGMLPWMGWRYFLFGDPGNGGPLLQPRGQTSVFYSVPPPLPPQQEQAQQAEQQAEQAQQQAQQAQQRDTPAEGKECEERR